MKSNPDPEFWRLYRQLPDDVRREARAAYRFWRDNPRHPSLQFELVDASTHTYSLRIGRGYRALGRLEGDTVIWFFIGPHDVYMRLLK